MRKNIPWLVVSFITISALVLVSCGPAVTTTAPPTTAPPTTAPPTTAPPTTAPPTTAPPEAQLGPTQELGRTFFDYDIAGLPKVELIMATASNPNTITDVLGFILERLIENGSKGQIDVKHYPHRELYANSIEIATTHLPKGTVDIAMSGLYHWPYKTPEAFPWAAAYGVPWTEAAHLIAMCANPTWIKAIDEMTTGKAWNAKPICMVPYGNWDYFSKVRVTKLEDFTGLRITSYGDQGSCEIKSWGAIPVVLAGGETYLSYYKGDVQGVGSYLSSYLDSKYYECGKYWLNMPAYPPRSIPFHYIWFVINYDKWKSLPEAYKRIIIDAGTLTTAVGLWEGTWLEDVAWQRLNTEFGMIDCGLSKNKSLYEELHRLGGEAGREWVTKVKGLDAAYYDNIMAWKREMGKPENCAKYRWIWEVIWKECDRRVEEGRARIKNGEPAAQVWDSYHFKKLLDMPYEEMLAYILQIPRVNWDWPIEELLK